MKTTKHKINVTKWKATNYKAGVMDKGRAKDYCRSVGPFNLNVFFIEDWIANKTENGEKQVVKVEILVADNQFEKIYCKKDYVIPLSWNQFVVNKNVAPGNLTVESMLDQANSYLLDILADMICDKNW